MGEIKTCTECGQNKVKHYEYGGYWCSECHAWFTSKQFKRTLKVKPKLKVNKKKIKN